MPQVTFLPSAEAIALAEKVSKYIVKVGSLSKGSPLAEYHEANELGLQLAMTLPPDLYRRMIKIVVSPTNDDNFLTFSVEVRKLLLGENAGNLGADEIAISSPGIGEKR